MRDVGCGKPHDAWIIKVCVRDVGCRIPPVYMGGEGMCEGCGVWDPPGCMDGTVCVMDDEGMEI